MHIFWSKSTVLSFAGCNGFLLQKFNFKSQIGSVFSNLILKNPQTNTKDKDPRKPGFSYI